MFPADKRELMEKYLNSYAPQTQSPLSESASDSHPPFNTSLNDSGIGTSEGASEDEITMLRRMLATEREKNSQLVNEKTKMSESHKREIELAIKDKAEMSEHYSKEIESLNRQVNAALRGTCSSGDMSSEGVLLLLEQKLSGFKLIKNADYERHVKWLESRRLKEGIESIEREAERGETEILEIFGEI